MHARPCVSLRMRETLTDILEHLLCLSGTLPDSYSSLTSLQELSVYHNNLSGALPVGYSNITSLQSLLAQHNSFTGMLRRLVMCEHKAKRYLVVLQANFVTSSCVRPDWNKHHSAGTLPAWSNMSSLLKLDLSVNKFSGELKSHSLALACKLSPLLA